MPKNDSRMVVEKPDTAGMPWRAFQDILFSRATTINLVKSRLKMIISHNSLRTLFGKCMFLFKNTYASIVDPKAHLKPRTVPSMVSLQTFLLAF